MLAPPTTSVSFGGVRFTVEPPADAGDALEGDVFHVANTNEHLQAGMPRKRDLTAVQRWCVAHVVDADGPFEGEWSEMTEAERIDVVDRYVDLHQLHELRATIIEVGSLPEKFIKQVRELYRVGAGGGCECPVCKGAKPDTPANRASCMYADIADDVQGLAMRISALGETVDLSAPWWVYQIMQARSHGVSEAYEEKRRERADKESADKVLRQRGYK